MGSGHPKPPRLKPLNRSGLTVGAWGFSIQGTMDACRGGPTVLLTFYLERFSA